MTYISKQTPSCLSLEEHKGSRIMRAVVGVPFLVLGLYSFASFFSNHTSDFVSANSLATIFISGLFIFIGAACCFVGEKTVIDGSLQELRCIRTYLIYKIIRRHLFTVFEALEIGRGDTTTPNYRITFVSPKRDIIIEVASMASYKEIVALAESISNISGLKVQNKELPPRPELQAPIPRTRAHDAP